MDHRQIILNTLEGRPTPFLPFIPRLDLWYNGNRHCGTLPDRFKNASLRDICDELGVGFHTTTADMSDFRDVPDADADIGLGIYHIKGNPYVITLHNVGRTVDRSVPGVTRTTYETPYGKLSAATTYDDRMSESGITMRVVTERLIKSPEDFRAAGYIFDNIELTPDYEPLRRYQEEFLGDRGLAAAWAQTQTCAMQLIEKELMKFEDFVLEMYTEPEEVEELASHIEPYLDRINDICTASPAQLVTCGGNYDVTITYPELFAKYFTPILRRKADKAHAAGKYLIAHTDGESSFLLEEFVKAGFDIADSVAPAPLTKLTLREFYDALSPTVTIWGGVPSIAMLEETMSDKEFSAYIDDLFSQIGSGKHFIVSVADTLPPKAKFSRIEHLAAVCRSFGPIG
ncbi:MAG: hypothetical protein IK136_02560 [Oscillospiraceae bacterium]|nr:hypothetical protein [Oscillospiraceae bacterium]